MPDQQPPKDPPVVDVDTLLKWGQAIVEEAFTEALAKPQEDEWTPTLDGWRCR